jgi:hypothetical protein
MVTSLFFTVSIHVFYHIFHLVLYLLPTFVCCRCFGFYFILWNRILTHNPCWPQTRPLYLSLLSNGIIGVVQPFVFFFCLFVCFLFFGSTRVWNWGLPLGKPTLYQLATPQLFFFFSSWSPFFGCCCCFVIHMCIKGLGRFSTPTPTSSLTTHSTPSLAPPPSQYPAETILPLSLILLKREYKQ